MDLLSLLDIRTMRRIPIKLCLSIPILTILPVLGVTFALHLTGLRAASSEEQADGNP